MGHYTERICFTCWEGATPNIPESTCYDLEPVPPESETSNLRAQAAASPGSSIIVTSYLPDEGQLFSYLYKISHAGAEVTVPMLLGHDHAASLYWQTVQCLTHVSASEMVHPVRQAQFFTVFTADNYVYDFDQGRLGYLGLRPEVLKAESGAPIRRQIEAAFNIWARQDDGKQCMAAETPAEHHSITLSGDRHPCDGAALVDLGWLGEMRRRVIEDRFQRMGRRIAAECLDDPSVLSSIVVCPLPPNDAWALYDQMRSAVVVNLDFLRSDLYVDADAADRDRMERALLTHEICGHVRHNRDTGVNELTKRALASEVGLPYGLIGPLWHFFETHRVPMRCGELFVESLRGYLDETLATDAHPHDVGEFYARIREMEAVNPENKPLTAMASTSLRRYVTQIIDNLDDVEQSFQAIYGTFPAVAGELAELYALIVADPQLSPAVKSMGMQRIINVARKLAAAHPSVRSAWAIPPIECPQLTAAGDEPRLWCDLNATIADPADVLLEPLDVNITLPLDGAAGGSE